MQQIAPTPVVLRQGFDPVALVPVALNDFQQIIQSDDLVNVFFSPNDFAESVVYTSGRGQTQVLRVLFDDPHTSYSLNDGAEFSALKPQFTVADSALNIAPRKGDRVLARGVGYAVDDYHRDGVGLTTVYLRLN